MRAALVLSFVLLCTLRTEAQVRGTVHVLESDALCTTIRAELRAVGVHSSPSPASADWRVECREEVLLRAPGETVSYARTADEDQLAGEVAEFVRARLLMPAASASGLTPPPSSEGAVSETPASLAPSSPETDSAPPPETETSPSEEPEPDSLARVEGTEPGSEGNEDTPERLSLALSAGGVFGGGALLPSMVLGIEPRVNLGDLSIGAHFASSLLSPTVNFFEAEEMSDDVRIEGVGRTMQLGLDLMYAPRIGDTSLRVGVGAGVAALRVALRGVGNEELGLRAQSSNAWAPVPYARASAMWRVHRRLRLRLDGRVGWSTREVVASTPFFPTLTVLVPNGPIGELSLGVEVFIL